MADADAVSGLEDHLGYWLRFVSNHVSQGFVRKTAALGVTPAEWVLLRELFRLGDVPPSRPAENLGLTRGTVSKLVGRLAAKGLVAQGAAAGDRRFRTLSLTPAGRALVPALAAAADANEREFFDGLDPARRAWLMDALREIVRLNGFEAVPLE